MPSLAAVRDDIPVIYADACHAESRETQPPACVYGEAGSSTSVFLIGDSHAAHWFPTFERLATERGWRLVSLTKSACPVADLRVYNASLKREYVECTDWRAAVLQRIADERPALVVISDSRAGKLWNDGTPVDTTDREDLWAAGLGRAILAIDEVADHVLVLGDTPNPLGDPPVCLSDHLDDALACATPTSKALAPAKDCHRARGQRRDRRDVHRSEPLAVPDRAVPGDHRACAGVSRRPPHDDAVRVCPRPVPRAVAAGHAGLTERRGIIARCVMPSSPSRS